MKIMIVPVVLVVVMCMSCPNILFSKGVDVRYFADTVRELKIGDQLPSISFTSTLNNNGKPIRISDYKGQLVIIDFWATYCVPCVAAFPKLDSLQRQFKGKLKILSVTTESQSEITGLLSKIKEVKGVSPTVIFNDKVLKKYFPHSTIPHCVWINGEGKVLSISEGSEITKENIERVLETGSLKVPIKSERTGGYIYNPLFGNQPLFYTGVDYVEDSIKVFRKYNKSTLITSVLTPYSEDFKGGGVSGPLSANKDPQLLLKINNSPMQNLYAVILYKMAIGKFERIIEIPDSALYDILVPPKGIAGIKYREWQKQGGGFCYQLSVDSSLRDEFWNIALNDVNRYFRSKYGIEGNLEDRECQYLSLEKIHDSIVIPKSIQLTSSITGNNYLLQVRKLPIDEILLYLRKPLQLLPYAEDETGIDYPIDLEINASLSNLEEVNKELNKQGLKLTLRSKVKPIVVIKQVQKKIIR